MSAGGILFPLAYRREVREAVDFIARANGNNLAIAAYWQALIGRLREELLEFGVDDFDLWQELMTFHMAVRKTFIDCGFDDDTSVVEASMIDLMQQR